MRAERLAPTSVRISSIACVEGEREPGNAVEILHVERHQSGSAAGRLDLVVQFFKPAAGARHRDDVGAGLRQFERNRRANAARGAGDKRDAVGERLTHTDGTGQLASASNDNCRGEAVSPVWSVSAVG